MDNALLVVGLIDDTGIEIGEGTFVTSSDFNDGSFYLNKNTTNNVTNNLYKVTIL